MSSSTVLANSRAQDRTSAYPTTFWLLFLTLVPGGVFLLTCLNPFVGFVGIICFAIGSLQAFVLLHECGHRALSRNKILCSGVGWLCGFICLLPFYSWTLVHHGHHIWAGWKDKDPTTAQVAGKAPAGIQKWILELAWKLMLPLPTFFYRFGIFWNPRLVLRQAKTPRMRRYVIFEWVFNVCLYVWIISWMPKWLLIRFALAFLLSLVLAEALMLSQHTHIPQQFAQGKRVHPFSPSQQVIFTRSLFVPRWIEQNILLGFNKHEAHHLHPTCPGNLLPHLEVGSGRSSDWLAWFFLIRRKSATKILYSDESKTGLFL